MKYQYSEDGSQSKSQIKTILIRLFLLFSLFGVLYQGYQFFQSTTGGGTKRGPDKYCGNSTCYQLLNIEKQANQQQIKKSYRLLARKFHPDKSDEQNALQIFQALNKAYETLMDEKSRFIYDLYLNNPQQSEYVRQFQYYNHKYIQNPQIPVSAVLIGIIICISSLQYVIRYQMYQKAIERISQGHDFKIKVNERCNKNKRQKQSVKQQMIQQIQIQGGLAKPTYKDILAYKIVLSPWRMILWVKSWTIWILNYYIMRRPYNIQAKQYLTCKALQINQRQWKNYAQQQKQVLMKRQLWIEQNKKLFINEKKREWLQNLRLNNPSRYSLVIKYMRQNNIKLQ